MSPHHMLPVVVVILVALCPSCLLDPIDLSDRQCDEEHQCVVGYTCIDLVCENDDDDDPSSSG